MGVVRLLWKSLHGSPMDLDQAQLSRHCSPHSGPRWLSTWEPSGNMAVVGHVLERRYGSRRQIPQQYIRYLQEAMPKYLTSSFLPSMPRYAREKGIPVSKLLIILAQAEQA